MTTTFGVIGSGRRTRFFLRLAKAMPDRLRVAGVVTRSTDRGAAITAEWGVPAFGSIDELLGHERPGYLAAAVTWDAMPGAGFEVAARRLALLAETPPAPDLAGLRSLWADVGGSGLVQVAEQYLLMPGHAARLGIVRDGVIGEPTSVHVSSTHLYHAVSMIRGLLGVAVEPAEVRAGAFEAPLADPLGPGGWRGGATPRPATTTIATIGFGGRMGLYDFTDNQWWNPLLSRRIVVRGSTGELADDRVIRLADPLTPVESRLLRRDTGVDLDLEARDLRHISFDGRVVYRNPFAGAGLSDDDIAVADLLERTGAWARQEGPAPYPLAEACQDHLIGLAIGESAKSGGPVTTGTEPWAS
ncbi:hypothetical protein GCM10009733_042200 [Nonomuraea maheshkhaliensis]|uniref:Gfo/Idh/MocA-like oxidoreductase N-terminal domain-containing protein n=1 Tax=Nonomuraea maheshkhaliensis TaxID=419590 RepID=A0ABN2FCJ2_9ACTN